MWVRGGIVVTGGAAEVGATPRITSVKSVEEYDGFGASGGLEADAGPGRAEVTLR